MGRPRKTKKDLPPGLYWTASRGFYFYRVRKGVSEYEGFGKIDREAAIAGWVRRTKQPAVMAVSGTVAELIDEFVTQELPRRLKIIGKKKLSPVTAANYTGQAPHLKALFGTKPYALTDAESMRPDVLRKGDVNRYLTKFEGLPGAVSSNRMVALLSAVFSYACRQGFTTFNPCLGVERNEETPRVRPVSQGERDAIFANGAETAPAYVLMARLTEATGMRLTDVRLLRLQHVTDDAIDLKQSKRGKEQRWELTPAVRGILKDAEALKGRKVSMYVFPSPKGTPYTEDGVHKMRRRALAAAGLEGMQHRDLRKAAINEANQMGMDAKEFAGHNDQKTTDKHYVNGPVKVKPIR